MDIVVEKTRETGTGVGFEAVERVILDSRVTMIDEPSPAREGTGVPLSKLPTNRLFAAQDVSLRSLRTVDPSGALENCVDASPNEDS